jgi:phage shock protein A
MLKSLVNWINYWLTKLGWKTPPPPVLEKTPAQLIDEDISKLEEAVKSLDKSLIKLKETFETNSFKLNNLITQSNNLEKLAKTLISTGKDNLAKEKLSEKASCDAQIVAFKKLCDDVAVNIRATEAKRLDLFNKVNDMSAKKTILIAKLEMAQIQSDSLSNSISSDTLFQIDAQMIEADLHLNRDSIDAQLDNLDVPDSLLDSFKKEQEELDKKEALQRETARLKKINLAFKEPSKSKADSKSDSKSDSKTKALEELKKSDSPKPDLKSVSNDFFKSDKPNNNINDFFKS